MATASVAAPAPTVHPTLKPAPTVTLWLRDGNRYLKPVEKKNHKLDPLVGLDNGVPTKFEKGVYCLRYRIDGVGKRTWEPVGNEPQEALVDRGKKELALHSLVNGMSVNDKPVLVTSLTTAGKDYLAETLVKVEAKQLARVRLRLGGMTLVGRRSCQSPSRGVPSEGDRLFDQLLTPFELYDNSVIDSFLLPRILFEKRVYKVPNLMLTTPVSDDQ
jgi:hypothetical protein